MSNTITCLRFRFHRPLPYKYVFGYLSRKVKETKLYKIASKQKGQSKNNRCWEPDIPQKHHKLICCIIPILTIKLKEKVQISRYHGMDLLTVLAFSELSWNKIFFCKRFVLKQVNESENSSDDNFCLLPNSAWFVNNLAKAGMASDGIVGP